MHIRDLFTLSLLTILLLVSCVQTDVSAPVEAATPMQPAQPELEPEVLPSVSVETESPEVATEAPPTEAVVSEPVPEFIPRGADLEATDPATVSLESGDLQLVEFFRYT